MGKNIKQNAKNNKEKTSGTETNIYLVKDESWLNALQIQSKK